METLKFKTTIKCSGCIAKVTPHLNEVVGEGKWEVDINNPAKILTITGTTTEIRVKETLEKVGFTAERM